MFEGMKIEKGVENMRDDDDELEMLLSEIPHTSSSPLNRHQRMYDAHQNHMNLVDHGYGHAPASCVAQKMNGYGHGPHGHGYGHENGEVHVHGMYDELLKHKYAYASSPVSGLFLKSDMSSSNLFSPGGRSPSPPPFQELKTHLISRNGFWLDFKKANESNLFDDFNLPGNFSKLYINDEQGYVPVFPNGIQSGNNRSPNGAILMNLEKYGASDNYWNGFSDCGGFHRSVNRGSMNFEGEASPALVEMLQHDQTIPFLSRSRYSPSRSGEFFSRSDLGNSALSSQFCPSNMFANNNYPMGFVVPITDVSSTLNRPTSRNGMNLNEVRDAFYSPNMVQLARLMPRYNEEHLLQYQPLVPNGRNKVRFQGRVSQGCNEAFTREDGLIIQGEHINYGMNRVNAHLSGHNVKGLHHESGAGKPSKCSFVAEAQGYIYDMAKDQHGCRLLQRMFDEGTSQDVQMIFNEIIDHVVELMMNPFGNYLMQKLLEVCHEEQRMHILLRVTEKPGELVQISINTYGTRVVQKLIVTLKVRQQISLVISALEPGFLALIKDSNGNHVVQRCLECFSAEDSKFIFIAAAKYCVEIATHQHGCCVLQRCIERATGELLENLISEISANGLLLAQDAFGNYVVQFILQLEIPSATSKLTSQFEGNYVHLSRQKFSSHVVEKCLEFCNNKARSKIIRELLSATYFEQLLQDPHANYVLQTALKFSAGPLHNSLVDAIESYKAFQRNSPYSKRIFSHKLLKRS